MKNTPTQATSVAAKPFESITGRDGYIITKALAYAVETIRGLPLDQQEASDSDDMQMLLEHMLPEPDHRDHRIAEVRAHLNPVEAA